MSNALKIMVFCIFCVLVSRPATAGELYIATASNFLPVAEKIAVLYEQKTGDEVILAAGSSGQLAGQIKSGAPFDVFLSADQKRPQQLLSEGVAVAGSQFTYAIGKLVLWSNDPTILANGKDGRAVLAAAKFHHLAVANPVLAPYGVAAYEVLQNLKLTEKLALKIAKGQNISQTQAMVASGAAELGFIAVAQLSDRSTPESGSSWLVPQNLYQPIRQDAVLLQRAANNQSAKAFIELLRSPAAQRLIIAHGYDVVGE